MAAWTKWTHADADHSVDNHILQVIVTMAKHLPVSGSLPKLLSDYKTKVSTAIKKRERSLRGVGEYP